MPSGSTFEPSGLIIVPSARTRVPYKDKGKVVKGKTSEKKLVATVIVM